METKSNYTQAQEYLTRRPSFLRRTFRFFARYAVWIVVIAVLALAFMAGRASVYRAHPEFTAIEEGNAILAKVGALMQLPAGETPTIATVKDAATAKQGQPFLASAENDDVIIVYRRAQMAILYRPSSDKIIAVGPVSAVSPPVIQPVSQTTPPVHDATTSKTKK